MNQQPELFDVIMPGTGHGSAIIMVNKSFAQTIAELRATSERTIFECAEICAPCPIETFRGWIYEGKLPDAATQRRVVDALSDPEKPPSAATQKRVEASHHLIWDKQKGWEMRVTVNIGRKVVGKRIRERLKTRNLAEAIARRDLIVASYKHLGLVIVDRRQKTQKPREGRK